MQGKNRGDPLKFKFEAFVMKEPSAFPKDAVDGMLLSLKETAEHCNLNNLMEVCLIFALDESFVKKRSR